MSKSTWSRTRLAGLIAASLSLPRLALGAEGSEVEDLRREVRQMEAQIQSLRAAIGEAAELDKQRAAVLTRALKNLPNVKAQIPEAGDDVAAAKSEPPPPPRVDAGAWDHWRDFVLEVAQG